MRKLFIFLAILILPVTAFAQRAKSKRLCVETPVLLNDQALDTSKSFTVSKLAGFDILSLDAQFTHANNGTLTFTCTGKSAKGNDNPQVAQVDTTLTTCSVASGTCTLQFGGVWVTSSLSADKDFNFPVGVTGQESVTCTVAHGGVPTTGDKISVTGRKCVE